MQSPALSKLLILQDRDQHRIQLESQLAAVPRDVAAVQQKIAAEKAAIEDARKELKELELKKKSLETELGMAEDKLAKYKNQQMAVRKNDEYQALGLEIEHMQTAIGELEGRELETMYAIDEAKKKFAGAEALLKQNIAGHEARLKMLGERESNLKTELEQAKGAVAAARSPLDEPTLRLYDRVAARQMPACVPIRAGKCGGCHLKVSSEIDAAARKGDKLATCDQCGRIVWWEA